MKPFRTLVSLVFSCGALWGTHGDSRPYVVVGTGQSRCYGDLSEIPPPRKGEPFYGQDSQQNSPAASYKNNGNGTVSDLNTGLMWVQDRGVKRTFEEARSGAALCRVGGFSDWRLPTIKELYSLINFDGGYHPDGPSVPYLDTRYFGFAYGNPALGERLIDCQDWSATEYLGTTMEDCPTVFGVNFADGRIKGYPRARGARGGVNKLYARYVRGNPQYGINDFQNNGDGTLTDRATGLMWSMADSGSGMNWEAALAWAQKKNQETYLGHADWRLPNAKELQSIVDYSRSPKAPPPARGAALDARFQITRLPDGEFPFFWTSTTHLDGPAGHLGRAAAYIAFGRATGFMRSPGNPTARLMDVHGAGAQRSDPKVGDVMSYLLGTDANGKPVYGRGPQGDVVRINNVVRLVRNTD